MQIYTKTNCAQTNACSIDRINQIISDTTAYIVNNVLSLSEELGETTVFEHSDKKVIVSHIRFPVYFKFYLDSSLAASYNTITLCGYVMHGSNAFNTTILLLSNKEEINTEYNILADRSDREKNCIKILEYIERESAALRSSENAF